MWYMTEERELMAKIAREFTEKEIRPFVPEMENGKYPRELLRRSCELGFMSVLFPPEVGGIGPDYVTNGIILEEMSKESFTMGVLVATLGGMAMEWTYELGTPEQIEKYVKPAMAGDINLAMSHTEPVGLFNWDEHQTRAVLDGDEWVINGGKIFTTSAGQADYYLVGLLTSEPDSAALKGYSLIIVPANAPGFEVGHIEHKLGMNGSSTGSVNYRNCRVPKENLLGPLDEAERFFASHMTSEWANSGAIGLGIAEGAYEKTLDYCKSRIQYGGSLFANHQVMRSTFAKMYAEIESFRYFLYSTLEELNRGTADDKLALSCKIKGSELALSVASECVNLWGGHGAIKENQIERYFRDAKVMFISGGAHNTLIDALSMYL